MSIIDEYVNYQELLNKSRHTIRSYSSDIESFLEFISEKESSLSKISQPHIRGFLAYLAMKNISKRSISRKLSSLKSFFDFLLEKKEVTSNPAALITSPKSNKKLPTVLTVKEFNMLSNAIDTETFAGKRDKAMIEMLYASGARSEELVSLNEKDLHLKASEAIVRGKGNKERLVFINKETIEAFLDYMPLKMIKFPGNANLFVNKSGKKISTRFLRKTVEHYAKKAGINKEVSPHTLRHSFATAMLDNGVDLKIIKELLGHASISSTQIYTHVSKEELRKCYIKYGPSKF